MSKGLSTFHAQEPVPTNEYQYKKVLGPHFEYAECDSVYIVTPFCPVRPHCGT